MSWFTKLTQTLLPPLPEQGVDAQAEDLQATVDADKKIIETDSASIAPNLPKPAIVRSKLSPFASRILEKAKIESLKDDDERVPLKSPAELFMTNAKAEELVGHIESLALEKSKRSTDKFLKDANKMPDTKFKVEDFLRKNDLKDK